MLKRFLQISALLLLFASVASATHTCTTCFIDFVGGSDASTGVDAAHAWQHTPDMVGASGNAASQAEAPGDSYYLKGGVTWPNGTLGMVLATNGTIGSKIYFGVLATFFSAVTGTANTDATGKVVTWVTGVHSMGDFSSTWIGQTITVNGNSCLVGTVTAPTWNLNGTMATQPKMTCAASVGANLTGTAFSANLWSRPVLNAGGTAMGSHSGLANVMVRPFANHMIIDNWELTGLFWTGTPVLDGYIVFAGGSPGQGTDIEIKNMLLHGWSHGLRASPTCTSETELVNGDSSVPNLNVGSSIHDSIITGLDVDKTLGTSGAATFSAPPIIYRNLFEYTTQGGVLNGTATVHDNTIQNIGPTFQTANVCGVVAHGNALEFNAQSTDLTIYNNVIRHLNAGTLSLWCATNAGVNCYAFNNVIYDTDVSQILDPAASVVNNGCPSSGGFCTTAGNFLYYNNTIECGPDAGPPSALCQGSNSTLTSVKHQNGFYITSGNITASPPTPTLVTNLGAGNAGIPLSTACGVNSYCANQAFAFSPISNSGITVGTGTSNSSFCTTINALDATAGAACLKDTTYGVLVDKTSWTVTGFARTALTRSTSTPSIGAYEFSGSGGSVTIAPGSYSYGTVTIGSNANSSSLVLTNSSGSTITFTGTTYTGANASDFTSFSNTCSGSLATAGTCTVVAKFSPTAVAGTHETATLNVAYTGFAGSPQTVALDGTAGTPISPTQPAPAPQIFTGKFTVLPLPATPVPVSILASAPLKSYLTKAGFSQDGITFVATLPLNLSGSNISGTPTCSIDGTSVPCACGSATSCVLQIPSGAMALPTASTDHVWSISFPGITPVSVPVLN